MKTTTTRRSAQRSSVQKSDEPKTTMNARSHAFTIIAAIAGTSRVRTEPLVSLEPFETTYVSGCGDDSSGEMRM